MLKRRIIIDKANRLYQFPPEILSLVQTERKRPLIKRTGLLDLAKFTWPIDFGEDKSFGPAKLRQADRQRLSILSEAVAAWMLKQHQVKLNPAKEIFVGGRITSLLFGLSLAFIEHGDLAFVPEVGIPLYRKLITACGGESVAYPVTAKNNWLPDFGRLTTNLGRVARLLFLNSPHNPTGAELNDKEMAQLARTAASENILVVNDAAYQAIPVRSPVSLLSAPGGKQVGVEVYSFAYQFGLPPLPFGFVVGNRDAISALRTAADLTPSYVPDFYIDMAMQAIREFPGKGLKQLRDRLAGSAAEANNLLNKLYLTKAGAETIPYLWARIEKRSDSGNAARLLYRRHRILAAPGTAFGENGQGFLRFSLTAGAEAYREAGSRIRRRMTLLQTKDDG
jgi:aspartate/methionine/tyrosine aminotransferase